MEATALSFVFRAAGTEHDHYTTSRVFTCVVGGRVGMNDTCYFTFDMKKLDPTPPHDLRSIDHVCKCKERHHIHPTRHLCSLLIYTPLLSPPRTRGEIVVFSHVKCAWPSFRLKIYVQCTCASRRPRRNRCVFSCKMRLGFISTVNLREMYARVPPTAEKSMRFLV